jgi:hypothetical protein
MAWNSIGRQAEARELCIAKNAPAPRAHVGSRDEQADGRGGELRKIDALGQDVTQRVGARWIQ